MTDYMNAGLEAYFVGIFTIFIENLPTVEEDIAIAGWKSDVLTNHQIFEGLEMSDRSVIVPPYRDLTKSRLYVLSGRI